MYMNVAWPIVILQGVSIDTWIIWLVLTIVFLVAEIATVNLVTIWFVIGSLAAIAAALLGASVWLQIIIMLGVSGVLLGGFLIIRPKLGLSERKNVPTNADRFIGQTALVIQDIDPVAGSGQIKALGQVWSAISADETRIASGAMTVITQIRGVKAVVRPQHNGETDATPESEA